MTRAIHIAMVLLVGAVHAARAGQAPGAEPKAFLRADSSGYYVALELDPPAAPNTSPDKVSASVFRNGKLLAQTVRAGDQHGAAFRLPLGEPSAFGDDGRGLLVAVSSYPTGDASKTGAFAIPVALEVQASISTNNLHCDDLAIQIAANVNRDPTPYEAARMALIQQYVRAHSPMAETELRSSRGVRKPAFHFAPAVQLSSLIADCFVLEPNTAPGTYDLRLTFPADAPVELRPALLRTGIVAAAHKNAPLSIDTGQVGKRSIEENLDLGLQFGSSVSKSALGVAERSSKASVDLRFAPLLNVLPPPRAGSKSLWFFTPVLLDARVSSGDVTKETLAQNRIVFGTDVELRHYTSPTTFPTYQRLIVAVRNAADRDFNQAEWKGVGELQLVFSRLNRPLAWQEDTEASQLDPTRDPKRIVPVFGVGWQLVPIVGAELGRTWRNELAIAAVEKTRKVYRGYFGGTAALDFTRYMTLSLREILFVRGEAEADRAHNYLLVKAEVPVAGFTATTAQAVFFAYERGGQPPFATPDVNALKLGYRLLWNGWGQQLR